MLDRDLLAVKYTNYNIQENNTPNADAIGSTGLEEIEQSDFDLITSNIPAKIGDKAIEQEFLIKPVEKLSKEGEYWIVVVSTLNRLIY